MASFSQQTTIHNNYHDGNTKLLGSKQDYVICGSRDEYKYHVILDGHGKGLVVNILSTINWDEIVEYHESPHQMIHHINKYIITNKNTLEYANNKMDGSTCIIVIIFEKIGVIKTYNIGDSMCGIKINDTIHFTKMHDVHHQEEVQRLKQQNILFDHAPSLKIISTDNRDATMVDGTYFNFKYIYPDDTPIPPEQFNSKVDRIAMTRSLGHNHGYHFTTLQEFECETYRYTPGSDSVTIITGTDGLWDILSPDGSKNIFKKIEKSNSSNLVNELLEFAEKMWKCKWNYHIPKGYAGYGDKPLITNLGGCDDIGIAIYISR